MAVYGLAFLGCIQLVSVLVMVSQGIYLVGLYGMACWGYTIGVLHITEIKLNIIETNVNVKHAPPRNITRSCDTRRGQKMEVNYFTRCRLINTEGDEKHTENEVNRIVTVISGESMVQRYLAIGN